MKRKDNNTRIQRLTRLGAALLISCASSAPVYAASLTISPSTGVEQVGQTFSVTVSVSGLDTTNDLYDYTLDLQFDPSVFKVLSANDGTIFNYNASAGLYIDGLIDNTNGFVSSESGIDINQGFVGTGGVLGTFTFEALTTAANSTIGVENVSLETFEAASNLGPPDIATSTSPVATLDTVNGSTAAPEPAAGALAALALAGGALTLRRRAATRMRLQPRVA
jgi:hypothetical protein